MNAPGHTAQYLSATSAEAYVRVLRTWCRDPSEMFFQLVENRIPIGTYRWRMGNCVTQLSANDAVSSLGRSERPIVVYADPPYTKDHYSRYYHVYESLILYDFPESTGFGRVRVDRFLSDFCFRTKVFGAFRDLLSLTVGTGIPLLLSYPSNGLASRSGMNVREFLNSYGAVVETDVRRSHSTLGGYRGLVVKEAREHLYLVQPR